MTSLTGRNETVELETDLQDLLDSLVAQGNPSESFFSSDRTNFSSRGEESTNSSYERDTMIELEKDNNAFLNLALQKSTTTIFC